jgi:hypothetical protein
VLKPGSTHTHGEADIRAEVATCGWHAGGSISQGRRAADAGSTLCSGRLHGKDVRARHVANVDKGPFCTEQRCVQEPAWRGAVQQVGGRASPSPRIAEKSPFMIWLITALVGLISGANAGPMATNGCRARTLVSPRSGCARGGTHADGDEVQPELDGLLGGLLLGELLGERVRVAARGALLVPVGCAQALTLLAQR